MPTEFSSLEELYLTRDDEGCRSSIAAKVNYHETMVKAIYDTAKEISHIKRNIYLYNHKKYKPDNELDNLVRLIQFSAGRLWVLSGMCLLEVFSAISPVDPLQKLKVQIECSKEEVFTIFNLIINI